ncbi:hypothetical protein [Sphingomonas morindae]|uniref:Uncharacterized protein n=1 Tax=Sphingomonas morindae TaxID=1541170 RepID=A0ABY4XBG9_9SPHN|nr:hypothetical protein [Sphingomonas morindae]USI74045.1 hypothetical protein LHA26_06170 [Sphingomonas morindae]
MAFDPIGWTPPEEPKRRRRGLMLRPDQRAIAGVMLSVVLGLIAAPLAIAALVWLTIGLLR